MDSKPIVKKILRSPSLKRKTKSIPITQKVTLEKVLGLTLTKNAGLACDPNTGTIAYPAGCVIVLFNPRKNKQTHIFNSSKKTLTTVAFSRDGKHLVSGESGHQPAVRVWDVEEKSQVAQFLGHKFGINCVVFSPNLKYIVSVGSQHDMMVNVWNWKTNCKVKSNKVSSKVNAVAFSEDGSYFVTVGNRHVKFWYLETNKSKVNETVPLLGRSGILGDQKDNFFCDVACGEGSTAGSTFCITQSGLLCEFNSKRLLDKWVELRTPSANCISVDQDHIFIGCSGGVVRVFSSKSLRFVTTLPKPHALGVDIAAATSPSHMVVNNENSKYPDTIALVTDTSHKKLTCVYNDHSLYIWDVRELKKVGKAWSFLFHSSCIWGIDTYPRTPDGNKGVVPPGSFFTCSSDDTIRIWNLDPHLQENTNYKHNIYSQEVLKVLYIDPSLSNLCDVNYNPAGTKDKTDTNYDGKNGVRTVKISPDGQHLASGDRLGNLRVHDLKSMEEVTTIEAHDGEILSLEFSNFPSGPRLLSSTSRDRLVHVFDVEQNYGLIQTLDDHSSAISAVKFTETDHTLKMLSCGADKSLLFRNAVLSPSFQFSLSQHLVGKTTLYDMDVDPLHKFVATACQDRNIRIYNIKTAKQKKCYKGSLGDDGVVTKVHLDPSGSFAATSSTDKSLCILDFYTGEVLATMFGHSEIATGVKFTTDLKHLISTGAEGCIFIWRLSSDFTKQMRSRLEELGRMPKDPTNSIDGDMKRGSFVMPKPIVFDQTDSNEFIPVFKDVFKSPAKVMDDLQLDEIPTRDVKPDPTAPSPGFGYRFSMGPLPNWAKPVSSDPSNVNGELLTGVPKGRWAQRVDTQLLLGEKTVALATDFDRRLTTDEEADLRRQTMVISQSQPENLPIITADDENNIEDDADFIPHSFTPRNLFTDFERSLNSTRGSDPPGLNNKWASRRSLLADGDDADDEETDSETREIIYLPPDDNDTSDANSNSYKVFAISSDELRAGKNRLRRSCVGSEGSIKDGDSESTDPLSLEDVEEEVDELPSLPTTPLEPEKDFTPTKSRFIQDTIENFTPIGKETFTSNLDNIEQQLSSDEAGRIFSPRLSISAKFLNRGLGRNVARQDTWFDSVQKRKDDMARAVDETRRKLESLGWGGERGDRTTHLDQPPERGAKLSVLPDIHDPPPRMNRTEFSPEEPTQDTKPGDRRKTGPLYTSRSKSMGKADTNSQTLQVSTFELRPKNLTEEPMKSPRPTGSMKNLSQREPSDSVEPIKSPRSTGSMRNLSQREPSDSVSSPPKPNFSDYPPPDESVDAPEKTRLYARRHSNDQHSYLKPTQSSRAKIARAASSTNVSRGRSSSSTEDLTRTSKSFSSLDDLTLEEDDLPVANFDNFRHSISRQKTVSVPNLATCFEEEEEEEPSNLYSLVDLSKSVPDFMDMDETSSSYSDNSSLPTSEPAAVLSSSRVGYSSRAMRDSSRKVNQWNTRRSLPGDFAGSAKPKWSRTPRTRDDLDRFAMPPPSKTQMARTSFLRKAAHAKRRSAPDMSLEQAKNILLGKSGILTNPSVGDSDKTSTSRTSYSNKGASRTLPSEKSYSSRTVTSEKNSSSRTDLTERPNSSDKEYPESGTVSNLKMQFSGSNKPSPRSSPRTFNISEQKKETKTDSSNTRTSGVSSLDANPNELPVREAPPSSSKKETSTNIPTINLDQKSKLHSSNSKNLPTAGKLSSLRAPSPRQQWSSTPTDLSSHLKVSSADNDIYSSPEKKDSELKDISPSNLTPVLSGRGTSSLNSPLDRDYPKQSTPNNTATQNVDKSRLTSKDNSSTVSAGQNAGILKKATKYGEMGYSSLPRQFGSRHKSNSKEKLIDDSCSEFDEISALTVTPSKLRSRQGGGLVLPWQTNGQPPPPPQSDSGVSSDTDESEPKRPPRRLPTSSSLTHVNRLGSQAAVSTLKPELSTKPKMSLPTVPTSVSQRRSSAPSSTHLQNHNQSTSSVKQSTAPSVSQSNGHNEISNGGKASQKVPSQPDKSHLKLPVGQVAAKTTPSTSDVVDCNEAIREMRDAFRRVTHMYEQVSSHSDKESVKKAEMLSSSLNDMQQTLAELSSRNPSAASRSFLPITPTPEDEVRLIDKSLNTSTSLEQGDGTMNNAYSMLEPILERYSTHLTDKVYNLIQRRLDSATPSSSSDT